MEEMKNENEEKKESKSKSVNEKKCKSGKKVLKATAVTFVAVALVGGGVFIGSKLPKREVTNNSSEQNSKIETTNEQKNELVTDAYNKSKKIDDGNNLINYKFRIPNINIDSDYVSELNKEINEKLISEAKKIIESNEEFSALLEIDYEYYKNNDILSVVIYATHEGEIKNYYVYNINTQTGAKVTNEEIIKIKGFDKTTFENKLSNALGIDFENRNGEFESWLPAQGSSTEESKKFYEAQYKLTTNLNNCKLENQQIYLGENNKLYVVGKSYNLAGGEYSNRVINLEEIKKIENNTNNNSSISESNTQSIGNVNTQNENSNYTVGINEIKKCLKDKQWLKNNVMMKKSCFNTDITGEQELTFMKIKSEENTPMVAVEATSEKDISREFFLVSYNNGVVLAKSITGFALHISHSNVEIDPNNQIADNTYFHMGAVKNTYINLKNASINYLDSIGYYFDVDENGNEKRSNFTKKYGEETDDTNITEEEYNKINSKYQNFKFYEISTKLTDSNIDEYIK